MGATRAETSVGAWIFLKIIPSKIFSEIKGLSKISYESSDWKGSRALARLFRFTELEPELPSASNAMPPGRASAHLVVIVLTWNSEPLQVGWNCTRSQHSD